MEAKKGVNSRYATLLARDVLPVQTAHLKASFELAPASKLAQAACLATNQAISTWEKTTGTKRAKPGELLLEQEGQKITLPLLSQEILPQLKAGRTPRAVRRELEMLQFQKLKQIHPGAGVEDLWQLVNQAELSLKRAGKNTEILPEKPLNTGKLRPAGRHHHQYIQGEIPPEALKKAIDTLVDQWGTRPAQAEAMVNLAAKLYTWCCPRVEELEPGQLVWLAHGTKKTRRTDPRLFQPVVLTLLTPEEMQWPLKTIADLKKLKMRQIERLTAEAWQQDGVLTTLDMEWILGISPNLIRQLLEAYHERFGILLPTAGTVLDMGRTLTHKALVVEMALEGLTTQEIARRIYHTPEAVDNYLKLFDRVLLLRYYRVPVSAMMRITGHSQGLLNEHLALVDKHFPNEEALVNFINSRGIKLEKSS